MMTNDLIDQDLKSYDFHLPEELIAHRPVADRHSSRLLVYHEEKDEVIHSTFREIKTFLPHGATLIFNRSKVFPCRLMGHKSTGGEAEVFILSLFHHEGLFPALIKASGKRKVGESFFFGELVAQLEEIRGDGTFHVSFNQPFSELLKILEEKGKIPLPPYIRRGEGDELDKTTYQTVFAEETGSVAAPTAGLHFSEELLADLKASGRELSTITLHVGAGTFSPVKTENILDHRMHEEFYSIDAENLRCIQNASYRVAVGTTTLRSLESSWKNGSIDFPNPGSFSSTSIFLHPGKKVHSINALVTNFHLPQSTLIMLVSALIGRKKTLELYEIAIQKRYRFFSYGDGMLILRNKSY